MKKVWKRKSGKEGRSEQKVWKGRKVRKGRSGRKERWEEEV
jgi:hypothetical protein